MDLQFREGLLEIPKFQCGVSWLFRYILVRPLDAWPVPAPSWELGIVDDEEKIPTCRSSVVSEGGRPAN